MESQLVTPMVQEPQSKSSKLSFSIDSILGPSQQHERPPTPPLTPPDEDRVRPSSSLSSDDSFIDCCSQDSNTPSPDPQAQIEIPTRQFQRIPQDVNFAALAGCMRPHPAWAAHPYINIGPNPLGKLKSINFSLLITSK